MADENVPAWLVYQRCIAAFAHEYYGDAQVTVQPNAILIGSISGAKRQIDVLIDARWGDDVSRRILVDAKFRTSKVDINDVEALIGMMADCRAERGVMVCVAGYTKNALRRAQEAINITILSLEDALEYGWKLEHCLGDCAIKTTTRRTGMVLWGETLGVNLEGLWSMLQTGKCDVCHNFHAWCWSCGERFSIPDYEMVICSCGYVWGSIPDDPQSSSSDPLPMATWLIVREDENIAQGFIRLDRKPMR